MVFSTNWNHALCNYLLNNTFLNNLSGFACSLLLTVKLLSVTTNYDTIPQDRNDYSLQINNVPKRNWIQRSRSELFLIGKFISGEFPCQFYANWARRRFPYNRYNHPEDRQDREAIPSVRWDDSSILTPSPARSSWNVFKGVERTWMRLDDMRLQLRSLLAVFLSSSASCCSCIRSNIRCHRTTQARLDGWLVGEGCNRTFSAGILRLRGRD